MQTHRGATHASCHRTGGWDRAVRRGRTPEQSRLVKVNQRRSCHARARTHGHPPLPGPLEVTQAPHAARVHLPLRSLLEMRRAAFSDCRERFFSSRRTSRGLAASYTGHSGAHLRLDGHPPAPWGPDLPPARSSPGDLSGKKPLQVRCHLLPSGVQLLWNPGPRVARALAAEPPTSVTK